MRLPAGLEAILLTPVSVCFYSCSVHRTFPDGPSFPHFQGLGVREVPYSVIRGTEGKQAWNRKAGLG